MKSRLQIAIIALFVATLWLPLLCTPFRFQKERKTLQSVERRTPRGTLEFSRCDQNLERWTKEVQLWYRESFAFRSKLMSVYNISHYLIHSYPKGFYGRDGNMFREHLIIRKIKPIDAAKRGAVSDNLAELRQVCEQQGVPCLFILIPAKETVHPAVAPRWIRERSSTQKRQTLVDLIRTNNFPVIDLSPVLKNNAEQTGRILFPRYDNHWNLNGALLGYYEMMPIIKTWIPEARTVAENEQLVTRKNEKTFSRSFYLDCLLSEPLDNIKEIRLPPVRIIRQGKEEWCTVKRLAKEGRSEVFCSARGTRTVVFIRDSFFTLTSQLLNHSFAHTVYLNHAKEGSDPVKVVVAEHPDLLVIALQENLMGDYLARSTQIEE
jgi:hypothetical protein